MNQPYPKVKKIYWQGLFLLAILAGLAWLAYFSLRPDFRLHVNFYSVGQGDAALIITPSGNKILIDGGPGSSVLQKLGSDLPFFERKIDLLVLSHPHADHISGLIEVIRRYKVGRVLMSQITHTSQAYKAYTDLLAEKDIPITEARAGQELFLDKGVSLQTLFPLASVQGQLFNDLNETSVVVRVSFGQSDFLFTGDSPKSQETEILNSGSRLDAEVLKVGHHGSKNSTGEQFLATVNPTFAVISVGAKNSYGHPHAETLSLLDQKKVLTLRTDQLGDIKFQSDGIGICAIAP